MDKSLSNTKHFLFITLSGRETLTIGMVDAILTRNRVWQHEKKLCFYYTVRSTITATKFGSRNQFRYV